mgnify:CR=1 FL=1
MHRLTLWHGILVKSIPWCGQVIVDMVFLFFFFFVKFRYDSQADIPNDIEGEQDRVMFIRTVVQIIV